MSETTPEPAPGSAQTFTWADVQQAITAAVESTKSSLAEQHQQEMDALRQQIAGGAVVSPTPEHGAGHGLSIAETWSLAEQTAARLKAEAEKVAHAL